MLRLENVAYDLPDGAEIIKGINLTIQKGMLTVVTGPNGGGKTTLAKLIAGLVQPSSGRILFHKKDITRLNVTERARMGIAYGFQQPVRFKGLTVRELLELAAGRPLKEKEICGLLGKVGLCANEYVDREMSGTLSGGESKRIELATVLARDAKLFIFDEPEAGIDLWSFSCLVETLEELRRQRTGTLLVISHQERILSIADEIIVLAEGRVRISGPRPLILPDLLSDERAAQCRQPVCPATAKAVRDATAKAVRDATAKSDRDAAEGLRLGKTEEGARRT